MPTTQEIEAAIAKAQSAGDATSVEILTGMLPAQQSEGSPMAPSMGQVAINAIPKGVANLINAPVALADLAGRAGHWAGDQIRGQLGKGDAPPYEPLPNYPMQAAQAMGLVRPEWNPQTASQRVVDAMIEGGVGFAALPATAPTVLNTAKNIITGSTAGGVGQGVTEVTDNPYAGLAASVATTVAARGGGRPVPTGQAGARAKVLQEGLDVGYVVPPSLTTPTVTSRTLELVGGKAATAAEAARRNQDVTNALAAQSIGLSKDTALTKAVLEKVREEAGKVYQEVGNLRPTSGMPWFKRYHDTDLIEQLKQARADSQALYTSHRREPHPDKLTRAKELASQAESIEADLEALAVANGRQDLIKDLAAARLRIARSYDIEDALNFGDLNVVAHRIGTRLDRGKPLTGELGTIGRFAEAFPTVTKEGARIPAQGVQGVDAVTAAVLGAGGYGVGGPVGSLLGAVPLVRAPARSAVLSHRYQQSFAPKSGIGLSARDRVIQALMAGSRPVQ